MRFVRFRSVAPRFVAPRAVALAAAALAAPAGVPGAAAQSEPLSIAQPRSGAPVPASDAARAIAAGQEGVALLRQGRLEAARARFAESRALAEAIGDADLAARSAYNIALSRVAVRSVAQDAPDARLLVAEAVRGELLPRGQTFGANAADQAALLLAATEFAQAAEIAEAPLLKARARAGAARYLVRSGLPGADAVALEQLATGLGEARAARDGRLAGAAAALLGEAALGALIDRPSAPAPDVALGLRDAAFAAFETALRRDGASAVDDARARAGLGALYLRDARYAEAESMTEQALLTAETLELYAYLYRWRGQLAEILRGAGRADAAIAAYEAAAREIERVRPALARAAESSLAAPSSRSLVEPVLLGYADFLVDRGGRENLLRARAVADTVKTIELEQFFRELCVAGEFASGQAVDAIGRARTAILYPIIQADRVDLILTIGDGTVLSKSAPIDQAALRALALRASERLREPDGGPGPLADLRRLHDVFIAPVAGELAAARVDTLVFAADGALRGVPVAALHDGERFLIERYAIANALSLQLVDARPLGRDDARAVVAGVTEALTVRRGEREIAFSALPAVASEVAGVAGTLPATVLLDDGFTKGALSDALSGALFDILHIASHASFGRTSEESFLLAHGAAETGAEAAGGEAAGAETEGAALTLDELSAFAASAQVRGAPIELLVLSACDTGAGDPSAETDNAILGLAGAAYKAGARSVIASLWPVFDESTSRLMRRFYEALTEDATAGRPIGKAEALRRAQLSLLADPETRHPAFWAAFVLVGNWL